LIRWLLISLDGFYSSLAALIRDPGLIRRTRSGDHDWLLEFDLSFAERERILVMAGQAGMEVMCSLYRSNRLAALVDTVPAIVRALGDRLESTVSDFWAVNPGSDLQFRTEAVAFCGFVRQRYAEDAALTGITVDAERSLNSMYE
jgi:hypothetical protein